MSWGTNSHVVIEASATSCDSSWTPISTNIPIGGTSYFNDAEWTNYPNRFYRLRWP